MIKRMVEISVIDIREKSKIAFINHGASPWIESHVADAIAKAESVGNHICGFTI